MLSHQGVVVKGVHDIIMVDLVEVILYVNNSKGYNYILVVIFTFTKYVQCELIKYTTKRKATKTTEKKNCELKLNQKIYEMKWVRII